MPSRPSPEERAAARARAEQRENVERQQQEQGGRRSRSRSPVRPPSPRRASERAPGQEPVMITQEQLQALLAATASSAAAEAAKASSEAVKKAAKSAKSTTSGRPTKDGPHQVMLDILKTVEEAQENEDKGRQDRVS